ncbi:50S ribosomal protein L28 [bacterium]|nr:50S ribosomal protein L28 [bacterium]
MSRKCAICGKTPLKSAKLTFSHKQNVHRQAPNLQTVRVMVNGVVKKMDVCSSCLKANKVQKAI